MKPIADPNDDTFHQIGMLNLRNEPLILDYTTFDSKLAMLGTSARDHHVGIPLTTRPDDFEKTVKTLFQSPRTHASM
jgi:hypothetical protein